MTELCQIHVHRLTDWTDPVGSRESQDVEFYERCTARGVLEDLEVDPEAATVWVNSALLPAGEDRRLAPGDHLTFAELPAEPFSGTLVAQALTVSNVAGAIFAGAAIFGVSRVISGIYGATEDPVAQEDFSSQTYSWGGIRTAYQAAGLKLPLCIGDVRTGGVVIQRSVEVIETEGKPKSILYLLIALSGGPVRSVAGFTEDRDDLQAEDLTGVYINGNPASNYEGVTGFVRLGTIEQEPVPGFDRIEVLEQVDLPITNEDPAVTDWSEAATYDLLSEAQAARLTLEFTQGLFEVSQSTGIQKSNSVLFDIRYRTLDALGNTTSDWLEDPRNPLIVTAATQQAFQHQIPVTFATPGVYTPPTTGQSVVLGGTDTHLRVATQSISLTAPFQQWGPNTAPEQLTCAGWLFIQSDQTTAGNLFVGWSLGDPDNTLASLAGFHVRSVESGADARILAEFGNTGSRQILGGNLQEAGIVPSSKWAHFAFTYQRDAQAGGINRARLYVNGALVDELLTVTEVQFPSGLTPRFRVGTVDGKLTEANEQSRWDDLALWERELTPAEISQLWSGGLAQAVSSGSPGLAALWRFNGDLTDETGNGNTLENAGPGAAPSYSSGVTALGQDPTPQDASRYRIEIQRRSTPSDDPLIRDEVRWENVVGITYDELAYPETALLGLHIDASEQLSGGQPTVLTDVEGRPGLRYDTGSGSWIEDFSARRNPAWALARYLTDRRFALGRFFDSSDLNGPSFAEWADYCDELLRDQRGRADVASVAAITYESAETLEIRFNAQPPSHWVTGTRLRIVELSGVTGATVSQVVLLSNLTSNLAAAALIIPVYQDSSTAEWVALFSWTDTLGANWSAVNSDGPYDAEADGATVKLEGVEERHQIDMVLDGRGVKGWDGALQIGKVGRGTPVRIGSKVRAKVSRPRSPSQLFNADSIVQGSFKLRRVPTAQTFNRAVGEILDRTKNWERNPIPVDHPELDNDPTGDVRVRATTIELRGVTRPSAARRELTFLLNAWKLLRLFCEFEAFHDAVTVESGDVVLVEHPMPQFGFGGIVQADASGTGGTTIDKPITLASGETYEIVVKDQQSNQLAFAAVTAPAGDYTAGTAIGHGALTVQGSTDTYQPRAGDLWAIGRLEKAVRQFEVLEISVDPQTFNRRIQCLEYDAGVYAEGTFPDAPEDPGTELSAPPLDGAQAPEIQALTVTDSTSVGPGGTVVPSVSVSWKYPSGSILDSGRVEIWARGIEDRQNATPVLLQVAPTEASSTIVASPYLEPGEAYEFIVRPVSSTGERSPLRLARRARITFGGQVPSPPAPGSLAVRPQADEVVYAVGGDRSSSNVEIRRGRGWLMADIVAVVSGGTEESQPTRNFVLAPTSAGGKAEPTLRARYLYGRGAVSQEVSVAPAVGADLGFDTALVSVSVEDQGSDFLTGAAAVSGLEVGSDDGEPILRFPDATSGAATGTYTSQVFDAGEVRTMHVSASLDALQLHPLAFGRWPVLLGSRRGANWDAYEGPLDPADPYYGVITRQTEIRFSDTADPTGATWRPYRPGQYRLRSFQLRYTFTRPAGFNGLDFNFKADRLAVQANPVTPGELPDVIDGGTF